MLKGAVWKYKRDLSNYGNVLLVRSCIRVLLLIVHLAGSFGHGA